MKVDEIRDRFLKFFEERGHTVYPSDSLIPTNDPTLLFTGAGMNQFKEEFLGRVKGSRRAVTCQKCIRTGDLENAGKTPDHHTFFEMLGNFSFGDYFKKEAIAWAWEFLTKELGLKENDLWVSVYKDDDEAYKIWKDIVKVPEKKILKLGEKDNFWPANAPSQGPNGPCGPCSEIFYGGPDGVEVWNLVFTQFDRRDGGRLDPLPGKNIDTGMGLERIARVVQGKKTNFQIDSFEPIIKEIERYAEKNPNINTINAIADHIRAVTFAIGDGVFPSNERRGYVIRKLIRKAFWHGWRVGLKRPFLYKLVSVVAKVMKKPYPELIGQREDIAQAVLAEEKRFGNTIQEGTQMLSEAIESSRSLGIISGESVFKLYDTYGFPLELTQEITAAEGMKVDIIGFEKCMEEQKAKSRDTSKIKKSIFIEGDLKLTLPRETVFIEDKEELLTKIVQISHDTRFTFKEETLEEIVQLKPDIRFVFLEKTNFYGEKGGQVGDTGWLIKDNKVVAEVIDAVDIAGRVEHKIKMKTGKFKVDDKLIAKIDIKRRDGIRKNHTATHLLHNALRKVLGQHVKQAGSLVAPDRLRFDFTHFKALTDEEVCRVEELVNSNIGKNSVVCIKEVGLKDAKKEGAIALFGEKYAVEVRMVCVGDYSKELCGGTHVKETKDIGLFKILSESSIASGVRRIEGVTGCAAREEIKKRDTLIKEIAKELKVKPDNIIKEIEKASSKIRNLERAMEKISAKTAQSNIERILKNCRKINGKDLIVTELKDLDMGLLRKNSDIVKNNLDKGIFMLASEANGKVSMILGIKGDFGDERLDAARILNEIGADFGIKGGGRPDFAQAGTRAGVDVKAVLKKAESVIVNLLM